ncbi:hypothetical protein WJX79_002492 [Trebouxia sp. C0005]
MKSSEIESTYALQLRTGSNEPPLPLPRFQFQLTEPVSPAKLVCAGQWASGQQWVCGQEAMDTREFAVRCYEACPSAL